MTGEAMERLARSRTTREPSMMGKLSRVKYHKYRVFEPFCHLVY
jgi:hypothetical protein